MEEEMRKVEEEFAFQEKWIKIFKRGKFFFQNVPELLILKIITKMKAKTFFKLLRTGKWMLLLCEENRDSLIIPFNVPHFLFYSSKDDFASKETKQRVEELFRLMEKLIRSKYYFHLYDLTFGSDLLTEFYSKNSYYFNRRCWTIKTLSSHVTSMNRELVQNLQPKIINLLDRNHNGPMPVHFSVPPITKHLIVNSNAIIASDFYNEIEQFGPLNCMITLTRNGHLEFIELLSRMKEVTKKRHLNHPFLEFLTFRRENYNEYRIFESWPELCDLLLNDQFAQLFYLIIVARSEIAVTISYLLRVVRGEQEYFTIKFERVASSQEWKAYMNNGKNFEYSFIQPYADKEFEKQKVAFTKQVSSRCFQGGRAIYPPLAPPEPAPKFVEFLKEFKDFDIQPEKLAPHKPKWKKTEKLPELPRKLPEIHSNNWLIEAKKVIKLRKFWMNFLLKRKFILELLPEKNVLDVAKRMKPKEFSRFFRSSKWINNCLETSHFKIRNHGGGFGIERAEIQQGDPDLSKFKEYLKGCEWFYLDFVGFSFFQRGQELLKEILKVMKEHQLFTKEIYLSSLPLFQDILTILKPRKIKSYGEILLPEPVDFPPCLEEIRICNGIDRFDKLISESCGLKMKLSIEFHGQMDVNSSITRCLKILKEKQLKSNINITITEIWYGCKFIYNPNEDEIFTPTNSEEVYVFRSMARGRGGDWNYFVRLEKARVGAVVVAVYSDSCIENSKGQRYSDIGCEYFPTMESFLDYFEREVGSKRRARDWMQLREKDETIEPREEDFNHCKIRKPYIQFNEQKEADDFKEVRRRFFS